MVERCAGAGVVMTVFIGLTYADHHCRQSLVNFGRNLLKSGINTDRRERVKRILLYTRLWPDIGSCGKDFSEQKQRILHTTPWAYE